MSDVELNYRLRYERVLKALAKRLEEQLTSYLWGVTRIDRVSARAKAVDRFVAKASAKLDTGEAKYDDPLNQIQDQVGARIIVFYASDVEAVASIVRKYYRPIEEKKHIPDSHWKFGYFGQHYVLLIPADLVDEAQDKSLQPEFFELQIKTLFQHAWSESNHDLGYKSGDVPLSPDVERKLAFTSAQAWGADIIFDELFRSHADVLKAQGKTTLLGRQ